MSAIARDGATLASRAAPAQYLTFRIADETYAVGILKVREILQYETVTKVPATPRSIRGVMNLRGSVVPVVDLAVKLGLPESTLTSRTCVVILEVENDGERMVMGVMADSVSEVIELHGSDIEPPPPFGSRVRVDYLIGMGRADKKFLLVLDIDKVLSAEDLEVASRLGEEAADAAAGRPVATGTTPQVAAGETSQTEVVAGGEGADQDEPGKRRSPAKPRKKRANVVAEERVDDSEPGA